MLNIHFQNINFLFILFSLLVPVIFFILTLHWKARVIKNLGNAGLLKEINQPYSSKLLKLKFFIVLSALGLLGISAANPEKKMNDSNTEVRGIDIIFALDVSKSMLAEDIKPSRLEAGKQLISNLIKSLNDNRVGLVVFGVKPFLQMPLTTDLTAASMFVNSISTDGVPEQGTDIGKAITLADNSLNTSERKYKAIILISDGEDHDSTARDAAKQAYGHGAVIFTIGLGSKAGAPIKEVGSTAYKKDETGLVIISKLNKTLLKKIAQIAGGRYFQFNTTLPFTSLLVKDISNLKKKSFQGNRDGNDSSFFWVFLSIAIVLLLIDIFIREVKRRYISL